MKTAIIRITGSQTSNSCISSAMIKFMAPRNTRMNISTGRRTQDKSVSLRSRVPGNWQARFWRPVKRGDPLAEFNQPHGAHLTGPEVGLGMFGDGAHLLIDLREQRRDKIHGDHALLRSSLGFML